MSTLDNVHRTVFAALMAEVSMRRQHRAIVHIDDASPREYGRRMRDTGRPCPTSHNPNPLRRADTFPTIVEGWHERDRELTLWKRMYCA